MTDVKYPKKRGETIVFSKKLCKLWLRSNKLRNPLTNRPLKATSKLIIKIENECQTLISAHKSGRRKIGGYKFVIEPIYGDGSCFFHSVTRLVDPNYKKTRKEGLILRNKIAKALTFEDYLELSNGLFAKISLVSQYNLQIDPIVFDTFPVLDIIKDMKNYKQLLKSLDKNYEKFLQKFTTSSTYADEYMLDFTAKTLGINIAVLGSESGILTSARKFSKSLPTIFLYNTDDVHYEPLVGRDGTTIFPWEKTKKIIKDQTYL